MTINVDAVVAAVTKLAADLGLGDVSAVVLKNGSNVLVHLPRSGLVARVPTLTAVARPGVRRWLARDIAMARHLAARGLPVTSPATDPPAGPYEVDGVPIALWRYLPHDPAAQPGPVETAAALAEFHDASAEFPGDPSAGPLADLAVVLPGVDLDPAARRALHATTDVLTEELRALPARPLHGDAHPGNLLVTPDGLVWNDFEDTWLGPAGWDLACLAESGRPGGGAAALAAYPRPVPDAEIDTCRRLRRLYLVVWYQLMAQHDPAHRPAAATLLTDWLTSSGPVP